MSDNKNNKITIGKKSLVGILLVAMLVGGGVAALTLSNTVSTQFTVYTDLPFGLAWSVNPADDYVNLGDSCIGELTATNGQAHAFSITMQVTVTGIAGVNATDVYVIIDSTRVTLTAANETFTGALALPDIAASGVAVWDFEFRIENAVGAAGVWDVDLYITGDPV